MSAAPSALPYVQLAVTALSAFVALASAFMTGLNFRAGRLDRLNAEIDEVTVAIVDAYKLHRALDRATAAFDPMISTGDRSRLRDSALAEISGVTSRSIWPSNIDFALIDVRRLVEDTPPASSSATLTSAISSLATLQLQVASGLTSLEQTSDTLRLEFNRMRAPILKKLKSA